ncbi:hypothetical protein ABPG77_000271 [Micractinium sp. CCAP 211/92]
MAKAASLDVAAAAVAPAAAAAAGARAEEMTAAAIAFGSALSWLHKRPEQTVPVLGSSALRQITSGEMFLGVAILVGGISAALDSIPTSTLKSVDLRLDNKLDKRNYEFKKCIDESLQKVLDRMDKWEKAQMGKGRGGSAGL